MKINAVALTSALLRLLGGIVKLLTSMYTSVGAAQLQLKQLRDSPEKAEIGANVGGIEVKGIVDENHKDDGSRTKKVAIGIYGDKLDTIGDLRRTPTPELAPVQTLYYGEPHKKGQLYRTVTGVTTEATNEAFGQTLRSSGQATEEQTFQASLFASENIADDVGLPLGSSSVGLLNESTTTIKDDSERFNKQIKKNGDNSVIGSLTKSDDPANNTELDSKSDLFGVSTVPSIDMKNVPPRMIIKTFEEMEAIIRSATREITEVVVHHTDTYEDQEVSYDIIYQWHVVDNGWSDVGYHFIIMRNGDLQVCRPISKTGAHARTHNKYSIGISFVGGLLGSSSKGGKTRSSNTFRPIQWKTFDTFMKAFYTVHPGGQVWGHNDVDPTRRSDPNFDVPQYIKSRFSKENVQTSKEAQVTGSLSTDEIIARH